MNTDTLIQQYCKKLRLGSNIYKNYSSIEANTNAEFLLELLRREIEHREISRKNRNLKNAGFDVLKTFDNYSFENIQIPQSLNVEKLKEADFLNRKENLILYGPSGTGKSHLATAIGVKACSLGKRVSFFKTASLVNLLSEAKGKEELGKFLKKIEKSDLLICDEWGYVPFEKEGSQLLFQAISDCYEKRSVIITTNLEFSKWNGIFYDEKLTSALIDRLIHHSHLLVFSGPSYRLVHSTIQSV